MKILSRGQPGKGAHGIPVLAVVDEGPIFYKNCCNLLTFSVFA